MVIFRSFRNISIRHFVGAKSSYTISALLVVKIGFLFVFTTGAISRERCETGHFDLIWSLLSRSFFIQNTN
jgi:hypothetical protein